MDFSISAAESTLSFPTTTVEKNGDATASSKPNFLSRIGAYEFYSPQMWMAALTETVATALLMFTLTISIIACLESPNKDPVQIALTTFVIFFFFILVTVPLSGGHLNPLVTYIAALKGIIPLFRASIYILAQCVGSIAGFLLIKSVMSRSTVDKYLLGGCAINIRGGGAVADAGNSGVSLGTALILEILCTFMILYLGVTVAFDKERSKELGLTMVCFILAASIAMAIFVSITATGKTGYTGAGLNPARCLGPAVFEGGQLWDGHWVFWVGPFLACSIYYGWSLKFPNA